MKKYMLFLCLYPSLLFASQDLQIAAKQGMHLVQYINYLVQCAQCGPLLPSNYRIKIDEPRHIIFPDNYQIWINSKRCSKKCVFNKVVEVITATTQKMFSLEYSNEKRGIVFIDRVSKVCHTHCEGVRITKEACITYSKEGKFDFFLNAQDAKKVFKEFNEKAAKK